MANGKNGTAAAKPTLVSNNPGLAKLCDVATAIGKKAAEGSITNAALEAAKSAEAGDVDVSTKDALEAVAKAVATAYAKGKGEMKESSQKKWANQIAHFLNPKVRKLAPSIVKEVRALSDKMGSKFRKHSGQDWQESVVKAVRAVNKAEKPVVVSESWAKAAVKSSGTSNRSTKTPAEKGTAAIAEGIKLLAVKMTPARKAALAAFEKAFGITLAA